MSSRSLPFGWQLLAVGVVPVFLPFWLVLVALPWLFSQCQLQPVWSAYAVSGLGPVRGQALVPVVVRPRSAAVVRLLPSGRPPLWWSVSR